jgi:hypothetical protein
MAKLLIDVIVPGNNKTYEFRLSGDVTAGQAAERMIGAILETENNAVALDPQTVVLCDADAGVRLDAGDTLRGAGVKSGHRLILV